MGIFSLLKGAANVLGGALGIALTGRLAAGMGEDLLNTDRTLEEVRERM